MSAKLRDFSQIIEINDNILGKMKYERKRPVEGLLVF